MQDHILIYVIVALNALCQLILIWSLKKLGKQRVFFMAAAGLLPLITALFMRGLVAAGLIHGHLVEQSQLEHVFTQAMGILLVAGPWLVTVTAIVYRKRGKFQASTA